MTTGGSAGFPDNVGCNSKAYVYNVGQANCIYIYLKNFTGADIKVFLMLDSRFRSLKMVYLLTLI